MTYKHLTEVQRYQIAALKKTEKNQKEIAKIICVSTATISRELKRNRGKKGYRPKQANQFALARRSDASKSIKMSPNVIALIEEKLEITGSELVKYPLFSFSTRLAFHIFQFSTAALSIQPLLNKTVHYLIQFLRNNGVRVS
jgi:Helix-turn-helix domain